MGNVRMNIKEAVSWLEQPGIVAVMPCDPHSQEAMKIILNFVKNEIRAKKQANISRASYRIYYRSEDGVEFTGIFCTTENEAKNICEKLNTTLGLVDTVLLEGSYMYRNESEKER